MKPTHIAGIGALAGVGGLLAVLAAMPSTDRPYARQSAAQVETVVGALRCDPQDWQNLRARLDVALAGYGIRADGKSVTPSSPLSVFGYAIDRVTFFGSDELTFRSRFTEAGSSDAAKVATAARLSQTADGSGFGRSTDFGNGLLGVLTLIPEGERLSIQCSIIRLPHD